MDVFVKELWVFGSKEIAFLGDLLPFCAVTSVESPLNQGTLYSTADWEGFNVIHFGKNQNLIKLHSCKYLLTLYLQK